MEWLVLILLIPYIYIIAGIYLSLRKSKPFKSGPPVEIPVSVVVACRNEEKHLLCLLSDLAAQEYSREHFEVIIVDDGSADSTYALASEFRGIKNYKVIKNTGSGKKSAVRTGVEASGNGLVVTTDADCRLRPGWLKTIASFYSEQKPRMITGPVEMKGTTGFFQRFQELEFLSLQGITAGTVYAENPVMCNGANLSFERDAYYTAAGRLHPELVSGDDVFLLHALKQRGDKICWLGSGDAVVTARTEPTLAAFLKQRARWISKAGAYSDGSTKFLAIVTFVTILIQVSLLIAGIFNPVFLLVFLLSLILKSVPDLPVIYNRAAFHKKKNLLWFFLPGQVIYPFYVLSVVLFWFFTRSEYTR